MKTRFPSPSSAGTSSTTDYELLTLDAAGHVTAFRRRDNQTISPTYDDLGRKATGLGGKTYAYDNLGRQTSVTLSGDTISNAWDSLSRMTSETTARGTVTYGYDLAGRRTQLTWPDSVYVTYDYDDGGDLINIKLSGSTTLVTYAYDNLGQRASLSRGNSVTTTYTFDAASRLTGLAQDLASTGNDQTLGYTYNPIGQIDTRTSSNSLYDHASTSPATRSYTNNGLNQTTAAAGATLTYNSQGNLSGDGTNSFNYDIAGRLTSLTAGATLAYDLDSRLTQVAGAATTNYQYDGADLITEYNTGGTVLRRYVHGPGSDEPLLWYEGSGTSTPRWLLADERDSIIAVADASGGAYKINTYDEYGVPGSTNGGKFQYTGQTWEPDIGLNNYKARVYSPTIGRFLQTDPIGYGDGLNIYSYVRNDPINGRDPTGLKVQCYDRWIRHEYEDGAGGIVAESVLNIICVDIQDDPAGPAGRNLLGGPPGTLVGGPSTPAPPPPTGRPATPPPPAEPTRFACGFGIPGGGICGQVSKKELCSGAKKRLALIAAISAADAYVVGPEGLLKQLGGGTIAKLLAAEIVADHIDVLMLCD